MSLSTLYLKVLLDRSRRFAKTRAERHEWVRNYLNKPEPLLHYEDKVEQIKKQMGPKYLLHPSNQVHRKPQRKAA